jgi:hypothetical protein
MLVQRFHLVEQSGVFCIQSEKNIFLDNYKQMTILNDNSIKKSHNSDNFQHNKNIYPDIPENSDAIDGGGGKHGALGREPGVSDPIGVVTNGREGCLPVPLTWHPLPRSHRLVAEMTNFQSKKSALSRCVIICCTELTY